MIQLFGQTALLFSFAAALIQGLLPLWGYYRQNPYLLAIARPAALTQCFFIFCAYGLLTAAFAINDFSIAYVAQNSHPTLPLMYRLTAVWGAHEGSILLWIVMLNSWTIAFTFTKDKKSQPLVLAVLGWMSICFLSFLLLTSNPFLPAIEKLAGHDLNPLLQDPGFIIHPPMLYAGYVGFSAAFAITLAALIQGRLDAKWAALTRSFAVAAWCFLTGGIMLGSWWAYRVLGWGGFWFWDPVENASLLPWLAGLALIHVLLLTEKRGGAAAWGALLAIITFALSILGTFLVRSGVIISVHAFASDPARGVFLLLLLAAVSAASLLIYLLRLPAAIQQSPTFSIISRETSLLINSIFLFIAMLTILLGTLYPLIIDALHLGAISVGAPYFNTVMLPLLILMMIFMGLGPLCRWRTDTFAEIWSLSWKKMLISIVIAAIILWSAHGYIDVTAFIAMSLSIWIILSVSRSLRLLPGMSLAHIGFAVVVIGILLSSTLSMEREARIQPGNDLKIGPYQFFFISTEGIQGSNYRGIRADFEVLKNTRHVVNLYPEKRIYVVRDMVMTKVDIHPGIFRDLYIALGEPLDDQYWSVRVYYKPFIRWIWFGGFIMIIGGLITLMQRKQTGTIS